MLYVATINTPGYLPDDDEPAVFDTAAEAWWYLYHERCDHEREAEVDTEEPPTETDCLHCGKTAEFVRVSEGEPGRIYRCTECHLISHILADDGDDSETGEALAEFAKKGDTGTIIAETPGYTGDHDLGLAYTVSEVEA